MASVVVWIGYLQWRRDNGMGEPEEPILRVLTNIQHRDAIIELGRRRQSEARRRGRPERTGLAQSRFHRQQSAVPGRQTAAAQPGRRLCRCLLKLYKDRVPAEADLVTYWFEKAREMVERKQARAVGLVATQAIRGGANREVLKRVAETGNIFMAWSDRDWINEGAAVHISIVGFDGGEEPGHMLDGAAVEAINADLTFGSDATRARPLPENANLCFMGTTKVGAFDLDPETARKMLAAPLNPNGRPNSDVVRPWVNALDITRRPRGMYIVDFGVDMPEEQAALYEMPFEYLREQVNAERESDNREGYRVKWWIHGEPRPDFRAALAKLNRYIVTPARFETPYLCLAIGRNVARSTQFSPSPATTITSSASSTPARTRSGRGRKARNYAKSKAVPLHAHLDLRDLPVSLAAGQGAKRFAAGQGHRRGRAGACEAARQLAQSAQRRAGGAGEANADQSLQQAPKWLENAHRKLDKAVFAAYGWPGRSLKGRNPVRAFSR